LQACWITATRAFSACRRDSRGLRKYVPDRSFGTSSRIEPARVSQGRWPWPVRRFVLCGDHLYRPAPIGCYTS
jgi:hypothetical protein